MMKALIGFLMLLLMAAAMFLWAAGASAQPAGITVGPPAPDATGVTFPITWAGGGAFAWSAAYSDGSASQNGVSGSPLSLRMPYHSSGQPASGWVCATTSCNGFTVPAWRAVLPPTASSNVTITIPEPTTYADGTPITDLASLRVYWRLSGGPETTIDYPVADLTGGKSIIRAFAVPAATGTVTAQVTAIRIAGSRESDRSATVSKVLGVTPPPPPPPPPPTGTLSVAKSVSRCRYVLTSTPPDTTGGWVVKYFNGTTAVTSPVELVIGTYSFTAEWSKTGQTVRKPAAVTAVCP